MCTVSWIYSPGGYELFCNRDEKHTRARALGPRIVQRDGVHVVSPADGDCGGSWISANEFGISVCLLNGPGPAPGKFSRGQLVTQLSGTRSAPEVRARVADIDLSEYAGFTLLALEPGSPAEVLAWDGKEVLHGGASPLVSSSFDPEGVRAARLRRFPANPDAAALLLFHADHGLHASGYSTCMHRDDAETVSFSRVSVTEAQVQFSYTPGASCTHQPAEALILPRVE
jgi:Transport and Golgi organisation 2